MPLGNLQRISLSTPIIEKHSNFNTIEPPKFNKRSEALRKNVWAKLRPNGRTEKQKYLTEPEKTQEKLQKV